MKIIGEKINGTRKRVAQAIAERDAAFIADLAQRQVEAGEVAPLEQVAVVPDRARVRAADVETLRPLLDDGWLTIDGLDRALASLWGCSVRTARRVRVRAGVTGKRGPRSQSMERA